MEFSARDKDLIHIDAGRAPANGRLSHGALEPGRYVRLIVEDSGSGMDEATLSRIFEPFFTTKDVGQGTGLGLSLVYAIITESGGAIDVKSALQQGSTFAIYLRHSEVALAGRGRDICDIRGAICGRLATTRAYCDT